MWCRSVFVSVLLLLGITHGIDVCRPFSVLGTKVELSDAFAEPVRFEGGFLELLCTTERSVIAIQRGTRTLLTLVGGVAQRDGHVSLVFSDPSKMGISKLVQLDIGLSHHSTLASGVRQALIQRPTLTHLSQAPLAWDPTRSSDSVQIDASGRIARAPDPIPVKWGAVKTVGNLTDAQSWSVVITASNGTINYGGMVIGVSAKADQVVDGSASLPGKDTYGVGYGVSGKWLAAIDGQHTASSPGDVITVKRAGDLVSFLRNQESIGDFKVLSKLPLFPTVALSQNTGVILLSSPFQEK